VAADANEAAAGGDLAGVTDDVVVHGRECSPEGRTKQWWSVAQYGLRPSPPLRSPP
jgi:hypothetical protein